MKRITISIDIRALVVILIIVGLLLSVVVGIVCLKNGSGLVILDSKITDIKLKYAPESQNDVVCIPVMRTLMRMGYAFTLLDGGIFEIEKDGKRFFLDFEKQVLTEEGDDRSINYIGGAPGISDNYSWKEGRDIYVSISTFRVALDAMESGYYIQCFPFVKVVIIFPRVL